MSHKAIVKLGIPDNPDNGVSFIDADGKEYYLFLGPHTCFKDDCNLFVPVFKSFDD